MLFIRIIQPYKYYFTIGMKYFYTLLLSFTCLFAAAQDLSLDRLTAFIHMPAKSVSDSLAVKGWKPVAELSAIKDNQMYQTYSYGNLETDKSQAVAWLRIHADNQVVNQLYYQLPDLETYTKVLNALKIIGTEKKDMQSIDNKQINTFYQNKEYTFQTITGGGSYTLMVMSAAN